VETIRLHVRVARVTGDLREPDAELPFPAERQRTLEQRDGQIHLAPEAMEVRDTIGRRHDSEGVVSHLCDVERLSPMREGRRKGATLGERKHHPGGGLHELGYRSSEKTLIVRDRERSNVLRERVFCLSVL